MNFKKIALLSFFILLLINCSSEGPTDQNPDAGEKEEPKPEEEQTEIYFTLNVLGPRDNAATDEWIIIHDKNGTLLDYRQYKVGDRIQFEAPRNLLTDMLTVTEFKYILNEDGRSRYHLLDAHTQIEKGAEWEFGSENSSAPEIPIETGKFRITVKNIPAPKKIIVSNRNGRLYESFSDYFRSDSFYDLSENIPLFEGADHFFVSILDGNNDLRLVDFSNPDGLDYIFNYSQFIPQSNLIEINLPEHQSFYLNVAAFEPGSAFGDFNGYWLHDIISSLDSEINTTPLKFGYLNNPIIKYRTSFSVKMENFSYSIIKYGDKLEGLEIPQRLDLAMVGNSLYDFQFFVDEDYESVTHTWEHIKGSFDTNDYSQTSWSVGHDKDFRPIIGSLPKEFLEKYPSLEVDKLTYISSRLKLKTEFGPDPGEWENEQITFYKR